MSNFSPPLKVPPLNQLEWLQGSPAEDLTHDIQLLLLIQPNCPGCHTQAIPVANELASVKQDFDIYCISTAFEDFEYNTVENAKLLLQGKLVGDAKKQLESSTTTTGRNRISSIPAIPMAHDNVMNRQDLDADFLEIALCASKENTREQMKQQLPPSVLEKMLQEADKDMLLPPKVAQVFWSVRAWGTPMWVLHRQSGEVIDRKFGQFNSPNDLLQWVQAYL